MTRRGLCETAYVSKSKGGRRPKEKSDGGSTEIAYRPTLLERELQRSRKEMAASAHFNQFSLISPAVAVAALSLSLRLRCRCAVDERTLQSETSEDTGVVGSFFYLESASDLAPNSKEVHFEHLCFANLQALIAPGERFFY